MERKIISTAAIFGMLTVILGAFGSHALKKVLPIEQIITFQTGIRYQMYHTILLLFIGTTTLINQKIKRIIYNVTVIGIILFSGSIYLLATNSLTVIDFKIIGFVTPIGGLFLISAWVILFFDLIRSKKKKK